MRKYIVGNVVNKIVEVHIWAFLELHDIRKAYTLNHQENVILKGINLNFERGSLFPFLGSRVVVSQR